MKFINRENELDSLNSKWKEKKSQLIIIYGKRRVGKTELIKRFIKGKPSVYFLADKRAGGEQLKELGALIGEQFNDPLLVKHGFQEWLDLFKYLGEKAKQPFVFAIDEYPYLTEIEKAIGSLLQKGWDEYLKKSKVFFILSGSSVAMMESETLIYKSPLYGRRSGQILLKPLSFKNSWKFFPGIPLEKFLGIFTIVGGMPAYIKQIDSQLSIKENIKRKIFPPTEFLHNEIEFALKEEFREPKNYLSIIKAIATGKTKFGEIVNETSMQKNIMSKYLGVLEKLEIIEKEIPVTEKSLHKSKKGSYKIAENFFRFWFYYIFPHKSLLEINEYGQILRKMDESFVLLESLVYEKVCREIIWEYRKPIFDFEKIGRWWNKDVEIDLVGINQQTKEILFGEAKWTKKKVGTNILNELKAKAQHVSWNASNRKEYYIIFSKSGFTKDLLHLAEDKTQKLFLISGITFIF